jgi:hypothetical protein
MSLLTAQILGTAPTLAGDVDYAGVAVTSVRAMPAQAGERSVLRLRIENRSSDNVSIHAVRLSTGETAGIVAAIDTAGRTTSLTSIVVGAGEDLEFDGRRLWLELSPAQADHLPGELVEAMLDVGNAEWPITVEVEPGVASAVADANRRPETHRFSTLVRALRCLFS